MARTILRHESPAQYFEELVTSAMQHQRLEADKLTSYYVINLLAAQVYVQPSAVSAQSDALGIQLARALQGGGSGRRDALRAIGDRSLFVAGFFSDSFNRRLVDIDYYMQLGERAYGSLADLSPRAASEVFDELAAKFAAFVGVLSEVSERSSLTSNADLMRLYERWQRTRNRHSGELLASHGIVPTPTLPGGTIH